MLVMTCTFKIIFYQGNIGTPESHFLELINACRLPPIIVKKLGLKFKKKGGKYYSSVPFDYTKSSKVRCFLGIKIRCDASSKFLHTVILLEGPKVSHSLITLDPGIYFNIEICSDIFLIGNAKIFLVIRFTKLIAILFTYRPTCVLFKNPVQRCTVSFT